MCIRDRVYIMDPASNDITDLFYYDEAGVGANVIVYKGPHGAGNGGNNGGGGYTAGRYSIKSSDGVNLRSGPSTDYERIGWIANGAEVEVSVVSGEWGKISYNGADGWICLKYTNKIADRVYTCLLYTSQKGHRADVQGQLELAEKQSQRL